MCPASPFSSITINIFSSAWSQSQVKSQQRGEKGRWTKNASIGPWGAKSFRAQPARHQETISQSKQFTRQLRTTHFLISTGRTQQALLPGNKDVPQVCLGPVPLSQVWRPLGWPQSLERGQRKGRVCFWSRVWDLSLEWKWQCILVTKESKTLRYCLICTFISPKIQYSILFVDIPLLSTPPPTCLACKIHISVVFKLFPKKVSGETIW